MIKFWSLSCITLFTVHVQHSYIWKILRKNAATKPVWRKEEMNWHFFRPFKPNLDWQKINRLEEYIIFFCLEISAFECPWGDFQACRNENNHHFIPPFFLGGGLTPPPPLPMNQSTSCHSLLINPTVLYKSKTLNAQCILYITRQQTERARHLHPIAFHSWLKQVSGWWEGKE